MAREPKRPTGRATKAPIDNNSAQRLAAKDKPASRKLSPTEQRNPSSRNLARLPLHRAIRLMLQEEAQVPLKLLRQQVRLRKAIRLVVHAFRTGGRLFYVGAGTSGRLGVLDASECPPTFSTPPAMVQAIIAGGEAAVFKAVEGAEDNLSAGARTVQSKKINRLDVVVGISASGTTPFVWGALAAAKKAGATTLLLCFNPYLRIPRPLKPTLVIATDLGPEVLTGSTRLKAGTATKLILNLLTTLAMVQLGKVRSNLMIDLDPRNVKLRTRAVRIVAELTGVKDIEAKAALERSGWVIRDALERIARRADFSPQRATRFP